MHSLYKIEKLYLAFLNILAKCDFLEKMTLGEFKPTQNLLSITNHDFDNFGGKKVVILTILTLNQAKS